LAPEKSRPPCALRHNYNVGMSTLRFEWDEREATVNAKKHGITFEEARSVFFDERARLIEDPDHSEAEERFIFARFEQFTSAAPGLSLLSERG